MDILEIKRELDGVITKIEDIRGHLWPKKETWKIKIFRRSYNWGWILEW